MKRAGKKIFSPVVSDMIGFSVEQRMRDIAFYARSQSPFNPLILPKYSSTKKFRLS